MIAAPICSSLIAAFTYKSLIGEVLRYGHKQNITVFTSRDCFDVALFYHTAADI